MPSPTFQNYIDGQWVPGPTFENRNPADNSDLVGEFVSGSSQDMADAVDAASKALPAWSAMPAPARGALLYRVADGLERKFDQLGEEMTREEGKTLPEAKGEVRRAINIFRYFAGEGSRHARPASSPPSATASTCGRNANPSASSAWSRPGISPSRFRPGKWRPR